MKLPIALLCSMISLSSFAANLSTEDKSQLASLRQAITDNMVELKASELKGTVNKALYEGTFSLARTKVKKQHCIDISAPVSSAINSLNSALTNANSVISNLENTEQKSTLLTSLNATITTANQSVINCLEVPSSAASLSLSVKNLEKADTLLASILIDKPSEDATVEEGPVATQKVVINKTKLVFLKNFRAVAYKSKRTFVSKDNGATCDFTYPTGSTGLSIPAGSEYNIHTSLEGVQEYGLFIMWGPTGNARANEALACHKSLSVDQVQKVLQENGLEFKDLE